MAKEPNRKDDVSKKKNMWLTEEDYKFYASLPEEYRTTEIREMLHEFYKWQNAEEKRMSRHKVKIITCEHGYVKQNILPDNSTEPSEKLWVAIDMLPPMLRRRLIAHYFEGSSFSEIGRAEGVSHAAVAKSIAKAVASLKVFLEENM